MSPAHIDSISVQFIAWKLRMEDRALSQEDAERKAIVIRDYRRLRNFRRATP